MRRRPLRGAGRQPRPYGSDLRWISAGLFGKNPTCLSSVRAPLEPELAVESSPASLRFTFTSRRVGRRCGVPLVADVACLRFGSSRYFHSTRAFVGVLRPPRANGTFWTRHAVTPCWSRWPAAVPMADGGPDGRRWSRWPAVVPMADGAPLVWAAGIFLARGRGAPCAAGTPLGQKPTPPPGASRGSPGTSPPAPAQVWSAPFAPRRVASLYFYFASRRPPL